MAVSQDTEGRLHVLVILTSTEDLPAGHGLSLDLTPRGAEQMATALITAAGDVRTGTL